MTAALTPEQRIEALEAELAACKRDAAKHRFLNVTCSQCGRNFGPGNFGFSRCEDHTGESYNLGIDDAAKWLDKRADDYDSEHGITDPDTGTREYPGDGLDYINELRENADIMKPLYIFDLDGTLALVDHRRHFVEGPDKDWRSFFAACVDDAPNMPVIRTLQALRRSGAEVWIWSGRSDEVKAQTVKWLQHHGCFGFPTDVLWAWPFGAPERFRMRKAGDYRADVLLKSDWLSEIEPPEYDRLTAVFDDRDSVVKMWRDAGVPCFQVAPGDF